MDTSKRCRCGEPAGYKTWVRRSKLKADGKTFSKRTTRELRWVCYQHYVEMECGLWPYACVRACEKKRAAGSDAARLSPEDFVIWISIKMLVSTRDKVLRQPRCPWCERKLRPYPRRPL